LIEIGKYNHLKILRLTSVGLFLGDEGGEEVLLPKRYCPEKYNINDDIDVFVYPDNEGRKVATNLIPKLGLNEFALLKVTAVNDIGAFVDWGLDKELLVPFKEQRQKMEEGRWYIVYLTIDEKTDRLVASNKLEKHLQNNNMTIEEGEEVELLVMQKSDLGFTVIVNNVNKGLIFQNEIFQELKIGEKLKGYVKNIRDDHKLDISLQPIGYKKYSKTHTELIYHKLVENGGFLAVTDESSPQDIYSVFGISKKAFKRSVGALFKEHKIIIQPGGIKLVESR